MSQNIDKLNENCLNVSTHFAICHLQLKICEIDDFNQFWTSTQIQLKIIMFFFFLKMSLQENGD